MKKKEEKAISIVILLIYVLSIFGPHIYGVQSIIEENKIDDSLYSENIVNVDDNSETERDNSELEDVNNMITDDNENNTTVSENVVDENTTIDENTVVDETNTVDEDKSENTILDDIGNTVAGDSIDITTTASDTLSTGIQTVTTETELVNAVADPLINTIVIGNSITITQPLNITRSVSFIAASEVNIFAPQNRHMMISINDVTLNFSNVILDGSNYASGGIVNSGVNTILTNVVIRRCGTSYGNLTISGTGIHNSGKLTINGNSKITDNRNGTVSGGGILNSRDLMIDGNIEITNNTTALYGGGIYCEGTTSNTIINGNVKISGNSANTGGGIYKAGNLQVGPSVIFSGNSTATSYYYMVDTDISEYSQKIQTTSFSANPYTNLPSEYGYNNYDISYKDTYTILYYGNGNTSGPEYTQRTYDSESLVSIETIPGLEKEEYIFEGWRTENGTEYNESDIITVKKGVTKLYAVWSKNIQGNNYTITLNHQEIGNNFTESITATYGMPIQNLSTPTRAGYIFKEWNTSPDGTGTKYENGRIYLTESNMTLYAIWGVFVTNQAELVSALQDSKIATITIGNDITIDEPLIIQRSVRFSAETEVKIFSPYSVHMYIYGYNATLEFQNVVLDGSGTGGGIYNGGEFSLTLVDVIIQNCYKDDGGAISNSATLIIKGNSKIINNNAKRGGGIHNFSLMQGRSLIGRTPLVLISDNTIMSGNTAINGGAIYNQSGKIVINGNVTISNNTATSDGGAIHVGTNYFALEVGSGVSFSGNTAQRFSYIMPADIVDHDLYIKTTNFSIDPHTQLIAQYGYNNYDISYKSTNALVYYGNKNVTGEAPASETHEENAQVEVKGKGTLYKPGYNFMGWSTTEDGLVEYVEGQSITIGTGATVLYAVWERNGNSLHTLTFEYNAAESGNSELQREVAHTEAVGELPQPKKKGYGFKEWNTDPNGNGTRYDGNTIYSLQTDTTIYAIWEANKYKITFNYQGAEFGNSEIERQVSYGSAIGTLPNPLKTGYNVIKWNTNSFGTGTDYSETSIYSVESDITLYAIWEANKYIITYEYNGATSNNTVVSTQVTYNGQIGNMPTPIKTGHTFKGWNLEGLGTGAYYSNDTIYQLLTDITVYAIWEVNKYNITFDYQGATSENSEVTRQITYGTEIGMLPVPGKIGHTLKEWNTASDGQGVEYNGQTIYQTDGDITLYAIWEANKYDITYNYQGATSGNLETTKQIVYNTQIGTMPNPGKTGHTFKGWNTNQDGQGTEYKADTVYSITDDIMLYAIWEANKYTITYDYQGATGGNSEASKQVEYGVVVGTLPVPIKKGYTFIGWNALVDGQGPVYTSSTIYQIEGNVAIYAIWEVNTYKITFDYQGATFGNSEADRNIQFGATVGILPIPTKTGHTFKGWNTLVDGQGTMYNDGEMYNTDNNITLYAIWEAIKYTITYDYQGATGGNLEVNKQVEYDSTVGILPEPTKTGHTFKGWNTNQDGQGLTYVSNTPFRIENNIILYAIWEVNTYKITFDYKGATSGNTETDRNIQYGATIGLLPIPIKTGNTFKGWNTNQDGQGTIYNDGEIYNADNDITLYAIWEANKYTITYDYQGATEGNSEVSKQIEYDSTVGTLPEPIKTGHTFKGWNTNQDGQGLTYVSNTPFRIENNIILYAIWEINTYKITYDYHGATSGNTDEYKNIQYGAGVGILPNPGKAGHTFKGWNTSSDSQGTTFTDGNIYTIDSDITLHAIWEANIYEIEFNYQGAETGNSLATKQVTYGTAVGEMPTPGKTGHGLKEWNTSSDGQGQTYTNENIYTVEGNTTLYAIWEANKYTMTYEYQGATSGNTEITRQIVYNTQIGEMPNPGKTGYTFVEWNSDINALGTQYVDTTVYTQLSDIIVYAIWEANRYEIIFNYHDATSGNTVTNIQTTYGNQIGTLPVPEKTGHTFKGWNITSNGQGIFYNNTTVYNADSNIVLHAIWEANKYNVSFEYQGADSGSTETTREVTYGTVIGELPNPEKTGHTFKGWNLSQDGLGTKYEKTTIYDQVNDITLYAIFEINKYDIVFEYKGADGGNLEDKRTIQYGDEIGTLPTPIRTGYTFKGWNTNQDGTGTYYTETTRIQSSNISLYAIWEANKYQITFEYLGNPIDNNQTLKAVSYDSKIGDLPTVRKIGHTFKGWNTLQDGTGTYITKDTIYKELDNITLYAIVEINKYEILFNYQGANGGNTEDKREITYGYIVGTLPVPDRIGYTFKGWNTNQNGQGQYYTENTLMSEGDLTLYAIWEANRYEITFKYQGAETGKSEDMRIVAYDSKIGELPSPRKTKYVLKGWNTDEDGNGVYYTGSTIYKALDKITLYAIWEVKVLFEITFDYQGADGANTSKSKQVKYGDNIGVLPNPTKTGYVFKGWNKNQSGDGIYYTDTTVFLGQDDMTMYAVWEVAPVTETQNIISNIAQKVDFREILYTGKLGRNIDIPIIALIVLSISLVAVLVVKKKMKNKKENNKQADNNEE